MVKILGRGGGVGGQKHTLAPPLKILDGGQGPSGSAIPVVSMDKIWVCKL